MELLYDTGVTTNVPEYPSLYSEELTDSNDVFLAYLSHEIRSPLNSIIDFTDLLLKKDLGERENDFVRTIKISANNLQHIINNVLDISKIESGFMPFNEGPLNVKDIFNSLDIIFSQSVKQKNLDVSYVCPNDFPQTLFGDQYLLTQLLTSLIENAIKFTTKGNVDVSAKILKEENGVCQVQFSIKDTGIGIAEDKQQLIFEKFRQAEANTSENFGGTGLGLSIAKQLVEFQGGALKVKSILGIGSVFSFTLPLKKIRLNAESLSAGSLTKSVAEMLHTRLKN